MKEKLIKAFRWIAVACVVLILLTTAISVYAADPYWNGHKWFYGNAAFRLDGSVPGSFYDDIENAASKWSAPSPFYFYRMYSEVPYGKGGLLKFGDPPGWAVAYTNVAYNGSSIVGYVITFDADLPQGWTESPCWQTWDSRYRLFSVTLHELGHAVDFLTVGDTNTVLYQFYRCYGDIYQRDRNAIDDLY